MKQLKIFYLILPFFIMSLPWIYLAIIWNSLPQIIPTHFGMNGLPDKYGQKNEILYVPFIFTVIGISIYFIFRNIHRIDPKKKYTASTSVLMTKMSVIIIFFLCGASFFVFHWTLKGRVEGLPVLLCGMGLFFAYLGNLMYSIKPNYFAGFRLPWTLENEENWRCTHQFGSKIWFAGGLLLAITSLVLKLKILIIVYFSLVFVMTLIPIIYSYNLYRRSTKSAEIKNNL